MLDLGRIKAAFPDALRPAALRLLAGLTRWTVRKDVREAATRAGATCGRVLGGDLRSSVFINPVGQTSPAYLIGWFETPVAEAIAAHVSVGDTVLDVGANVGYHTLRLAKRVGTTGAVHCFEPSPDDRRLLRANLDANNVTSVRIDERAAAASSGRVQFAVFRSPGVHHIRRPDSPLDGTVFDVDTVSLDEYVVEQGIAAPSFVKVDVEGGEVFVLEGAAQLLTDARPVLAIEARRSTTLPQITAIAARFRYDLTILQSAGDVCDVLLTPRVAPS